MSSLRERIEGLVKLWRNQAQLDRNKSADMQERLNRGEVVTVEAVSGPYVDLRETCADELAAALVVDEQGLIGTRKPTPEEEAYGLTLEPLAQEVLAAAPSLHKEGLPAARKWICAQCKHEHYSTKFCGVITEAGGCMCRYEYLESVPAALHKEGAGGDLRKVLQGGLELVESAFAHVSHGGPTRADAEKWLKEAKDALG